MKISIIFFVQIVLVLVLSCESPVQDTKKEPDKIAAHDMWDYLNGSWRITAPPNSTGTYVFNRSKKTVYHKAIDRFPNGEQPSERTDRAKFYRKGSTEIITLIIDQRGGQTGVQNRIVQRKGPNRMVWLIIEDDNDPPKSFERVEYLPPVEFQRNP